MTVEPRAHTPVDALAPEHPGSIGWGSAPAPSAGLAAAASFPSPHHQPKPWGHEVIFATGTDGYVGKLILVRPGHALSLQYHELKDETICMISGEAVLDYGPSGGVLASRVMRRGDTVHLPATVVHRITARTTVLFVEASTAALGWQRDVVRLSDDYGRAGTNQT